MARYFFHVRGGAVETLDQEGVELADDEAARRLGVQSVREMVAWQVLDGVVDLSERVEVETRDHRLICAIAFDEAVAPRVRSGSSR